MVLFLSYHSKVQLDYILREGLCVYPKLRVTVLFSFILMLAATPGYCFDAYNPEGSGILCFSPSPYTQQVRLASKDQLSDLWFYNLTLTAENDTIHIIDAGITVEAHNNAPKTREAMLSSQYNTEEIWLYVQSLKPGQAPAKNADDLISAGCPRFDANSYRTIPVSEMSSQKNMFAVEFRDINITVTPGEKVVLSFFGRFRPEMAAGTKIAGHNLVPTWSYTARNIKFKSREKPNEYIVQ